MAKSELIVHNCEKYVSSYFTCKIGTKKSLSRPKSKPFKLKTRASRETENLDKIPVGWPLVTRLTQDNLKITVKTIFFSHYLSSFGFKEGNSCNRKTSLDRIVSILFSWLFCFLNGANEYSFNFPWAGCFNPNVPSVNVAFVDLSRVSWSIHEVTGFFCFAEEELYFPP